MTQIINFYDEAFEQFNLCEELKECEQEIKAIERSWENEIVVENNIDWQEYKGGLSLC